MALWTIQHHTRVEGIRGLMQASVRLILIVNLHTELPLAHLLNPIASRAGYQATQCIKRE